MKAIETDRSLLLILALAIVLRLSFEIQSNGEINSGEFRYASLSARQALATDETPIYPLLLRYIHDSTGTYNTKLLFIFQALLGAFVVIPIYVAASRIFNRSAGLISATVAACYPNFVFYVTTVSPEALVILLAAAIAAICVIETGEAKRAIFCAVLASFGVLVRPYFIFVVPGLVANLKRRLFFVALFLAMLAPLTIRNSIKEERFVPIYKETAFKIDLSEYTKHNAARLLDFLYQNFTLIHRWSDVRGAKMIDGVAAPHWSYFSRRYCYLIVIIFGFVALARYAHRKHLAVILPPIWALVFYILLSGDYSFRIRPLLEVISIIYIGYLLHRWASAIRLRFGGNKSSEA